jgi:hypothetical protein
MAKKLFEPGNSGRPKGSGNKSPTRGFIRSILHDPATWNKFKGELKKLKGRHYTDAITKMIDFDAPKYSSINFSIQNMNEEDLGYLIDRIREQEGYAKNDTD